jgi:NitT/TauT family transport system substrate-binding protein
VESEVEVRVRVLIVALVGLLAVACSGSPGASSPGVPLKVGLGYIPSVQFAQFYLAKQKGYYSAAGLDVTLENKIDPELITLVGQGAFDVGLGDGTSVIPAVSQGIPIKYVATVYAQFPSVVIARATTGITTPADLKGHTLGTPGKYGSSWIVLQALLSSAGLTPDDLTIKLYPDFGQATALAAGQVDAATGFVNNEPVVLARKGIQTNVLRVDAITPLPGPGLITGTSTLSAKRDALRDFVAATLRAMQEIQADPQKGLDATFAVAPDLATDPAGQRAILDATIAIWSSPYTGTNGLGAINPDAWAASVAFMKSLPNSGVTKDVPVTDLISTDLLPAR